MLEKRCQKILAAAVETAEVEVASPCADADFLVHLGESQMIGIEAGWAGEGWPQEVRRAAAEADEPWPENFVLFARRFSPGAIEWLRERDANWADEAGQARIMGPQGLVVIREPALGPRTEVDPAVFAWSRSAIFVAEAILTDGRRPLRLGELADESGWSVAQVAKVLKSFDGQQWTAKRGPMRGRRAFRELINPDGMLASWTAALADSPRRARITHRATDDVLTLLQRDIAPALTGSVSWAVSGWAGLELRAPFATITPSLHIYIADTDFVRPLSRAIERAALREVDEGGRITFWEADTHLLNFTQQMSGLPVVGAPRLFADLSMIGGRGGDAADHIKEQLLDPLHREPASGRAQDG